MRLSIHAALDYTLCGPTDIILSVEAAMLPEQVVESARIEISPTEHFARMPAHDAIGDRLVIHCADRLTVEYEATVAIQRILADVAHLGALPMHRLPQDTIQYLFGSRYCPVEPFQRLVEEQFGGLYGGERIAAIADFIQQRFAYIPGSSNAETAALDTFVKRQGVCRDFAHVLIALARASNIPARLASVYAPNVSPPDFHAVAEVFLAASNGVEGAGEWHMVDATGMATEDVMAKIGVGRDAADVAFLTAFAPVTMVSQSVSVEVLPD